MTDTRILSLIPHRPPFLWVDHIISQTDTSIRTRKTFEDDLDVFQGHYPGNPLLPGVLLCEAIFQSGALLLASSFSDDDAKIPVLTRISDTRFKRRVLPGETVDIEVGLIDTVSSVSVLRGKAKVGDQLAVKTEFYCALIDP
ncbi:MAG: beta-hydroxyacyl-ACP dehydratase [Desulfofustis sp.]|nr:beta-hydroxyacyl-ACP dehydratase [Desulfofustis sp.]MBT8352954.1 beta-hydroxyacyl-ACP dehydratase [Desulfofustis sp.]NNF48147.1 beta-hydroxyacyl-ACP dehydratase [Desulfofustis sp.]NNK12948.1 beta-hydroxyacyl-ACP dehydratase [Desulfofustis sp.]NNK55988.1 beta-hydroxyacyl-ACP dehydratase [Desulfofustis sp.]